MEERGGGRATASRQVRPCCSEARVPGTARPAGADGGSPGGAGHPRVTAARNGRAALRAAHCQAGGAGAAPAAGGRLGAARCLRSASGDAQQERRAAGLAARWKSRAAAAAGGGGMDRERRDAARRREREEGERERGLDAARRREEEAEEAERERGRDAARRALGRAQLAQIKEHQHQAELAKLEDKREGEEIQRLTRLYQLEIQRGKEKEQVEKLEHQRLHHVSNRKAESSVLVLLWLRGVKVALIYLNKQA
ncbi:octapeptide-repeat protein T2-like [Apteryx rowi]|uniref:octapeptide-repeat protein T2-like n=1 Tax=Apteryx rowi TaxID=308060 RepID=UPI000E1DD3AA|nr:octapeptide-repeat protein T2-like [Apteryx rowi]